MTSPSATFDVPRIGKVRKTWVWAGLAAAGLYIGWRYYQAAKAPDTPTAPETSDVGAPVDPSGVVGAGGVSGNTQYAGTTTNTGDVIDTNDKWVAKAVDRLGAAGMDPAAVYVALGDYLARKPLDDKEQSFVSAAVAAAGPPPVGGPYAIIPQIGAVTLTAPTGLRMVSVERDRATLSWDAVPGAQFYHVWRVGVWDPVFAAKTTSATVTGLKPATRYEFVVAADTLTGKLGPKSGRLKVTTKK